MFNQLTYTIFWVLCIILAILAAAGIGKFLHKVAKQKQDYQQNNDWYRFVVPTVVAILLAYFGTGGHNAGFWAWAYFLLIAVGIPVALAFFLNKEGFEKKNERVAVLVALVLLLNAAFFTAAWTLHYRNNHASDINDGNNNANANNANQENPHAGGRNWFLIPIWVLTILASIGSSVMWRRNNQKESDDDYLPF